MVKPRRVVFWIHLTLGITTGLVGGLMAGTGVIMAFADTYLDIREHDSRTVAVPTDAKRMSLTELTALVNAKYPKSPVTRIALDRDPAQAVEFYRDPQKLDYVNPYTGAMKSSDSVPLRRRLHKGVEQWHRFLGLQGDRRPAGKFVASWINLALVPLLLTGLLVWWPPSLRWQTIRAALVPGSPGRSLGTHRSWHSALGFWVLILLLIMVVTATTHSFEWVRTTATRFFGTKADTGRSQDSLWAPGLGKRPVPAGVEPLTPDQLLAIADREAPLWTQLSLLPAAPPDADNQSGTATMSARTPGRGPSFFPVTVQVDPFSGVVLDVHSWDDLSGGTRFLAWSRWLHKGEAFGRIGQIIAGLACLVMLILIYTGWAMAIQRLLRSRRPKHLI